MHIKDYLLWAREWNMFHRSSPKYRGAIKRQRLYNEKVERLIKKEAKNASK